MNTKTVFTPPAALLLRLERKLTSAWMYLRPGQRDFLQGASATALVLLAWSLWPHTAPERPERAVLTADRWVCTHTAPAGLHADCTVYERKGAARPGVGGAP